MSDKMMCDKNRTMYYDLSMKIYITKNVLKVKATLEKLTFYGHASCREINHIIVVGC